MFMPDVEVNIVSLNSNVVVILKGLKIFDVRDNLQPYKPTNDFMILLDFQKFCKF